jgi:hypothetical protein
MQVPSSSWANPAAHSQQGLGVQRVSSTTSTATTSNAVNQLEQSTKAGDRDANERYEGPTGEPKGSPPPKDVADANPHDILELPADDGMEHSLDLKG